MPQDPKRLLHKITSGWFIVAGVGVAVTLLWIAFLGWLLFEAARFAVG